MGSSLLSSFSALGGLGGTLLAFLVVLTVVVFFHELGHFLIARLAGVRVLVFSIGFGPELFGFNDRHGTRWKISAIPLGGYVKFFGDESAASTPDQAALAAMNETERQDSFFHKKVGWRAAIVAAGPIANFLLAIVIFTIVFMFYGKPSTSAIVDEIVPGSPAAMAGFQPGDIVREIDGRTITSFEDIKQVVTLSAGEPLTFVVERGGTRTTLQATPRMEEEKDAFGNVSRHGMLGIKRTGTAADRNLEKLPPLRAVSVAVDQTWQIIATSVKYMSRLVVGRESADQLGGPIRIAQLSGQVATLGLHAFLHWIAVISVSIGFLNLFPIPLLDGGHLLFYAIEAVRGRPLSDRAQEVGFRIGLAIVLMLMVFTTYNDLLVVWNRLSS
jgi:regulator of sigma E protease